MFSRETDSDPLLGAMLLCAGWLLIPNFLVAWQMVSMLTLLNKKLKIFQKIEVFFGRNGNCGGGTILSFPGLYLRHLMFMWQLMYLVRFEFLTDSEVSKLNFKMADYAGGSKYFFGCIKE
jgi:hypothetical protein